MAFIMIYSPLIGMYLPQAYQWLSEFDGIVKEIRVNVVDAKPVLATADYRIDRINVEIEDGRIKAIRGIG